MRKRVTTAAFLWSLAATAGAQSGAEITMPPNATQQGLFPFANSCQTGQTFKISAEPPAEWLRIEPATVNVRPGTSFAVRVTVNTAGNRKLGTYNSSFHVICATCAATDPPCLQDAKEFAISMTVANVRAPGNFTPMAAPSVPPAASVPASPAISEAAIPRPVIPADPPPSMYKRLLPFVVFGLLATGVMGGIVALRGLFASPPIRRSVGNMGAESERHRVKR